MVEPASDDRPESRPTRWHALRRRLRRHREALRDRPNLNMGYRIALGVFGTLVLLAGIVLIPYPGPGWLIVFAGLGILATEFHWAHRINVFVRRHYQRWTRWLGRQNLVVKLAVMTGTGLIVLTTLWLLDILGPLAHWLGPRQWAWLHSPLLGP